MTKKILASAIVALVFSPFGAQAADELPSVSLDAVPRSAEERLQQYQAINAMSETERKEYFARRRAAQSGIARRYFESLSPEEQEEFIANGGLVRGTLRSGY